MIGYVGLGSMGGALAKRLALSHDVLAFDLSGEARKRFADSGGQVAESVHAVADSCDIVFLCLPTSQHVESAIFGPGGIAKNLKPGTIVVDQTTGDPSVTRRLAADLSKQDVAFVDAPVSGGPRGANAGTIAIMVGADAKALETIRPILESISPNIFHAGGIGNGHVIKLANNLLSGGIRLLTAEALTLAAKSGVPPETAIRIIKSSGGSSSWLQQHGENLYVHGKNVASFTVGLSHKDIALACELGKKMGMPTLLGSQVQNMYQLAVNQRGYDMSANDIIYVIEEMSGASFIPAKTPK